MMPDIERGLESLASYYAGRFATDVRARHGFDHDVLAHALWVLAREAEKRREQWLSRPATQTSETDPE